MKRTGNIFEKITQLGNLESAIMKASKGKTKRKSVEKIFEMSGILRLIPVTETLEV